MTSERKTTVALLVCLALSLGVYLALRFVWTDWNPTVLGESLRVDLILAWPVISFFCLQWLLCRVEKFRWPRWAPLVLVAAIALIGALYLFGALGGGWDALGGGFLLCWCVAPAIGICLGWMAGGAYRQMYRGRGPAGDAGRLCGAQGPGLPPLVGVPAAGRPRTGGSNGGTLAVLQKMTLKTKWPPGANRAADVCGQRQITCRTSSQGRVRR